ncbi:uncharacterized protein SCHCODRAFT_01355896 [Schizophyllum commune H4-8]|nr:uncharacterized protein SCHCODRAFT_01355896 [Schizophyllum commune H4-8]KAI5890256.1 hypothetical protein SCHCODRAFT_01355896 [Schizophyllum commune H4-8]
MMKTIAADFAFYGVQLVLSVSAIIILTRRYVQSRLTKAAILGLLLSSTISTVANISFYLVEFPSHFGSSDRAVDGLLFRLGIVITVAQDFNVGQFVLSDAILVSARAIHQSHSPDLDRVGSIAECAWDFWRGLSSLGQLESNIQFLPRFIPFLATNVIATSLIGIKLFQYRREIKGSLSLFSQRSQVETVLVLLLESGVAYILFWVVGFVVLSVAVHSQFSDARIFTGVYHHIAGIYPTCVLFVAMNETTESLRSANVSQALRFAGPSEAREGDRCGANCANEYQPRYSTDCFSIGLQDMYPDGRPDASVRSKETTRGSSEGPVACGTGSEAMNYDRKGAAVRSTEGSSGI